jgi:hypothetical protein
MSRDPEAKPDPRTARLYDKRTVERNIKKGLVSRKDYEKYLKSLEDAGEKGVFGGPAEEPDEPDMLDDEDDEVEDEAGVDAEGGGEGSNSHS